MLFSAEPAAWLAQVEAVKCRSLCSGRRSKLGGTLVIEQVVLVSLGELVLKPVQ